MRKAGTLPFTQKNTISSKMLDTLKFIQGAVARKDHVPALVHFRIADGRIRGFNGTLALGSPIDLDLDVTPKATQFVKAIQTCADTIQLHMTPTGRLAVKSGRFKAFIDCTPESFPTVEPEGTLVELATPILPVLKVLAPFIADDASRPWARGILFRGQTATATNNIVLIEHWLDQRFPVEVNIPRAAIMEILRIGVEPSRLQMAEGSITFHYDSGRWLRSQVYATSWPDVAGLLDRPSTPVPVPPELWSAAEELAPFTDELGRLHFCAGSVTTSLTDADGASITLSNGPEAGCFNCDQLIALSGLVKTIDFTLYPKPCMFFGNQLRGAIVGMRV